MRTRRSQSSSDPMPQGEPSHRTVLLHEAIDALDITPGKTIVDATLGGAGHSAAICEKLGDGIFIGFDADQDAIERAAHALAGVRPAVHLVRANFRMMEQEVHALGIERIDGALFDLGWSSFQLSAGRGFSFQTDEPLSMAYDASQALNAAGIVNTWSEESLADVIYGWGEDRFSRRIARAIVEARDAKPIETARELGEIVYAAYPARERRGRLHPATKTFQALRIAVNDELGAVEAGLEGAWSLLSPGGRIAVITFHSIEDRIVKHRFASWEKNGEGKRTARKPLTPSSEELAQNPRARSAKLRTIEKI